MPLITEFASLTSLESVNKIYVQVISCRVSFSYWEENSALGVGIWEYLAYPHLQISGSMPLKKILKLKWPKSAIW